MGAKFVKDLLSVLFFQNISAALSGLYFFTVT